MLLALLFHGCWLVLMALPGELLWYLWHGRVKHPPQFWSDWSLVLAYGFSIRALVVIGQSLIGWAEPHNLLATQLLSAGLALWWLRHSLVATWINRSRLASRVDGWTFVGLSLLVLSYFNLPGALYHETDTYYWLGQARVLLATGQAPYYLFNYWLYPQGFSAMMADWLVWLDWWQPTNQIIIRSLGSYQTVILGVFWLGLVQAIKPKNYWLPGIISLSLFLSNYWFLGFVLGADISPKFWGFCLLLVLVQLVIRKDMSIKWGLNLTFLLAGLWFIHLSQILFFSLFLLAVTIPHPRRLVQYPLLVPLLAVVSWMLFSFLVNLSGSVDVAALANVRIEAYDIWVVVKNLGPLSVLPLLLIFPHFREGTQWLTWLVFLGILLLVIYFPAQAAVYLRMDWHSYRSIQYVAWAVAMLVVLILLQIHKRGVLLVLMTLQLTWLSRVGVSIYFNRINQVPAGIVGRIPPIEAKAAQVKKDQSIHRAANRLFTELDRMIQPSDLVKLDHSNELVTYYGVALLSPARIYLSSFPQNPSLNTNYSPFVSQTSDANGEPTYTWVVTDQGLPSTRYQLYDQANYYNGTLDRPETIKLYHTL